MIRAFYPNFRHGQFRNTEIENCEFIVLIKIIVFDILTASCAANLNKFRSLNINYLCHNSASRYRRPFLLVSTSRHKNFEFPDTLNS
jgi:hypothetical protein